jgi:hypothetical protein
MRLFDRQIRLRVGDTEINGLDIAFDIEKDETSAPNPCHIEIFNLNPINRAILSKYKNIPVLLEVGYNGHIGIVFKGDLISCQHLKEGTSWKTVLASGDGAMAIRTKRIDKSYTKGTPIKTVIEDLAKQVGLPKASPISHLTELDQTLSRGFMVSGNPMTELARVLSPKNIQASIQNQALQLRRIGEAVQKEAVVLSAEGGLIDSPEVGSKGELIVRSLLVPELLPGRQVMIQSAAFKGLAITKKVRFIGSSFGAEWEAELVCQQSNRN